MPFSIFFKMAIDTNLLFIFLLLMTVPALSTSSGTQALTACETGNLQSLGPAVCQSHPYLHRPK